jgi:hypothetical protein
MEKLSSTIQQQLLIEMDNQFAIIVNVTYTTMINYGRNKDNPLLIFN